MSSHSNITNSPIHYRGLLQEKGIPLSKIRDWNSRQKFHADRNLKILEFDKAKFDKQYWRCHFRINVGTGKSLNKIDAILKNSFFSRLEGLGRNLTKSYDGLKWDGFFIPPSEIKTNTLDKIDEKIKALGRFKSFFDFESFQSILIKSNNDFAKGASRVFATIWNYAFQYGRYLNTIHVNETSTKENFVSWYASIIDIEKFESRLPSYQITSLVLLAREAFYSADTLRLFHLLLKQSNEDVQDFFAGHQEALIRKIGPKDTCNEDLNRNFVKICLKDEEIVYAQELVDNSSKLSFASKLPLPIQEKFGIQNKLSLKERFQKSISRLNILERVQKASFVLNKNKSIFSPPEIPWYEHYASKWYDLKLYDGIKDDTENNLNEHLKREINRVVNVRWASHQINLGNMVTCPFFRWTHQDSVAFLKWNVLDDSAAIVATRALEKKNRQELEEEKYLEFSLRNLNTYVEVKVARNFISTIKPFSFKHLDERWKRESQKNLKLIQFRMRKRIRQMRTYGIISDDQVPETIHHLYLDEILAVEEEVKPYITFVNRAFQTALPIKKMTYFNEFRHSHDGIEFDPETISDQSKWQRGEVMKILKHDTVYGEIQQVNAFCLDFSGSMFHERMRNLFKVLYLIITGLKDRKIYNAIHFFNEKFIPNVEFSLQKTDHKILFKILSQITVHNEHGILYTGYGGTNISAGVKGVHAKITEFTEKLKERRPTEAITASMFVISDGEPTLGMTDLDELAALINEKRKEGNISIKGIYIKPKDDLSTFISTIFGEGNFVENIGFDEGVKNFVSIMTKTFELQRKEYKAQEKHRRVFGDSKKN